MLMRQKLLRTFQYVRLSYNGFSIPVGTTGRVAYQNFARGEFDTKVVWRLKLKTRKRYRTTWIPSWSLLEL